MTVWEVVGFLALVSVASFLWGFMGEFGRDVGRWAKRRFISR